MVVDALGPLEGHADRVAVQGGWQMQVGQQVDQKGLAAVEQAQSLEALEAVRVAALGKKGSISALMGSLGAMDPEARKILEGQMRSFLNLASEQPE